MMLLRSWSCGPYALEVFERFRSRYRVQVQYRFSYYGEVTIDRLLWIPEPHYPASDSLVGHVLGIVAHQTEDSELEQLGYNIGTDCCEAEVVDVG